MEMVCRRQLRVCVADAVTLPVRSARRIPLQRQCHVGLGQADAPEQPDAAVVSCCSRELGQVRRKVGAANLLGAFGPNWRAKRV